MFMVVTEYFPQHVSWCSYEERVHRVESIVQKHKQPTIFESFAAQVFSPASLPGRCSTLSAVKNVLPNFCPYLCQLLTDFQNSFTGTLWTFCSDTIILYPTTP